MAVFDDHKNFSYSTVATAPSPATSGTSLVVAAGEGARFPTAPFNATVWPAAALALPTNAEVVRVTALATDTLTLVRAQEASSARSIVVGDQIAATITDKVLTDIETAIPTGGGLTVLASDVSVATLTGSTTETTMFTCSVPGGTLGTTGLVLIEFVADHLNNTGGNTFFQVKVKYGGQTVGVCATPSSIGTSATRRSVVGRARLVAANATNAQRGDLFLLLGQAGTAAAPPTTYAIDTTNGLLATMNNGMTVDSTAAQALDITFFQSQFADSRLHTVHVLKG